MNAADSTRRTAESLFTFCAFSFPCFLYPFPPFSSLPKLPFFRKCAQHTVAS